MELTRKQIESAKKSSFKIERKMQKIAINTENIPRAKGYFAFSEDGLDYLVLHSDREEIEQFKKTQLFGIDRDYDTYVDMFYRFNRNHPLLIKMIEELGSGVVSKDTAACWIEIVEIPDGAKYEIVQNEDAGYEEIILL